MAMMPKRVKFRKSQRGHVKGRAMRGNTVAFGDYGLQALEAGWIKANVLEAGRVAAVRGAADGRVYIRVFPHKSVTSTPEETRMGTGKGEPDYWCAVVRPGSMLFEIGGGVPEEVARETLKHVAHKMPVATRFVKRGAMR
jgi:large subunit ribosomal protein L16